MLSLSMLAVGLCQGTSVHPWLRFSMRMSVRTSIIKNSAANHLTMQRAIRHPAQFKLMAVSEQLSWDQPMPHCVIRCMQLHALSCRKP